MKKPHFDPAWVKQAKNGDGEAFRELYICSYQTVHILMITMVRADEETIADLIQDTYLKVYQRLDQLEQPEKFRAWVKQIARNTALDYIKKTKVLAFSELYVDEDTDIEIEDPDASHLPEIAMDRQETLRLIHEILDSLPDGQRAVISMHYLQGIPVKEIAATLGKSESTIKVQLFQGRKNLAAKVREMENKNDIKLYSFAPMSFLSLLVRGLSEISLEPDMVLLEKIIQKQMASAGTSATAATKTVVSHVAGKIAAVVAAIALGGGILGVTIALAKPPAEVPTEPATQIIETTEPTENITETTEPTEPVTEATEPEVQYDYEQLIEEYTDIISGNLSVDEASVDMSGTALYATPANGYLDENGFFVNRGGAKYHIAEYDINGDLINEIITLEEPEWGIHILDIFTIRDGEPVWLVSREYRGQVELYENGIIGMYGSGGADAHIYEFYRIQDGELVKFATAEFDRGEYKVNGTECSKEMYGELVEQYEAQLIKPENWNFDIIQTIEQGDN